MAHVDKHPAGTFCWLELGTTDQDAAKKFYSSLFGWTANDFPMGDGETYTMFQLDGRDAAATYTMNQQMRERGVPPHWMLYISANNADETVDKARNAGGKVVAGPFDVMDFGRMASLEDPTGAHFSVWQPGTHLGSGIAGVPGTLVWAELSTPENQRAVEFYTQVFGWQIKAGQDMGGYLEIHNAGQAIGGVLPAEHRSAGAPPHWMAYFLVDNTDDAAAKVKQLGGHVKMEPTDIEKVGRFAIVTDPQGAYLALFQPLPRG
jgi:hypothetical protein